MITLADHLEQKPERVVAVGISAYGDFKCEMAVSLVHALARMPDAFSLIVQRGCFVEFNREQILKRALADGASHLIFIDTDMAFPHDAITRLMDHGKDIVGVNYATRTDPSFSTVKFVDEWGGFVEQVVPKELFRCAAVGTGLMCIDLKRLAEKMQLPFFEIGQRGEQVVGEDVSFCLKAAAAGLEVWCDPTIPVGHIGEYRFEVAQ